MERVERSLEKLGFSSKTAAIYIALLQLGEATVSAIAEKAKLRRTTVYNLLPDLIQNSYIKTTVRKSKRLYFVEDVRHLRRTYEDKLDLIDKTIPELQVLHNIFPTKPKISFYEGDRGVRDFYQDSLDHTSSGDTILEVISLQAFFNLVPEKLVRDYVPQRIKKNIRIRLISSPSETAQSLLKTQQKELREMKIIPNVDFSFKAGQLIYGDKVGYISFRENFIGVIIESREINQLQRASFDALWSALN